MDRPDCVTTSTDVSKGKKKKKKTRGRWSEECVQSKALVMLGVVESVCIQKKKLQSSQIGERKLSIDIYSSVRDIRMKGR